MENQKEEAAAKVVQFVKDGQIVALGTGSTAALVIKKLGRRVSHEALQIRCVCSSYDSLQLATLAGLRPEPPQGMNRIDVCIDGSDEIDPQNNLLKGAGGAHTLEKILIHMAKQVWIVADSSKKVKHLGTRFPIPIEILPDAVSFVKQEISHVFADRLKTLSIRQGSGKKGPLISDFGNFILDVLLEAPWDPQKIESYLQSIPGVVENGIFSLSKKRFGALGCVWGNSASDGSC